MFTQETEANSYEEFRIELLALANAGAGYKLKAYASVGEAIEFDYKLPLTQAESDRVFAFVARANSQLFRSAPNANADEIRVIGERLFNSICDSRVASLYNQSLALAKESGKSLRVRLVFDRTEVASLPWEFLYDPWRRDFVALSTLSPIVRQWQNLANLLEPGTLAPPLRVFVAEAEVSSLDYGAEQEFQLLEQLRQSKADQLVFAGQMRRATRAVFSAPPPQPCHLLHLIMSGDSHNIAATSGAADSLFVKPVYGATLDYEEVKAEQLRQYCANIHGLQLVVLNGDCTEVLAAQLAPVCRATIGWRGRNTLEAYLSFTRGLYTALLNGVGLEMAVTEGRRAIDLEYPGGKEWGMPVLYLQMAKGFALNTGKIASSRGTTSREYNFAVQLDNPKHEREWRMLSARLSLEEQNKAAVEAQAKKFEVSSIPDYISDQLAEINSTIKSLKSQLNQFKK